MNISVERLPECRARLSADVPTSEVAKARQSIVAAFQQQAKVPGFRPGKTPASVVEKKFAGEIDSELRDRLARQSYAQAYEEEKVEILGIVSVERELFESDGSYSLVVEIVTEPEIDVPDYKGIPVEIGKLEVTESMIDGYIESSRKRMAELKDADRASAPGDVLVVNYSGTLDGEPLADRLDDQQAGPFASGEDFWVEIPEEGEEPREMIPGFSLAVAGMSPGEERTVEIEIPGDFPLENLAGKTVVYEVSATEVKERELPEVDADFAAGLGAGSVEELRELVREQFERQYEDMRNRLIDDRILSHLNEEVDVELPQHIVFNETQRQVNDMVMRSYQEGMGPEQIEEQREDLVKAAEEQAKNNVKTLFVLETIAGREGIRVTDDELTRRINLMAMQQNRPVKKIARELRDEDRIDDLRRDLLISKTIEFLRENASINEVDLPAGDGGEPESGADEGDTMSESESESTTA